MVFFSLCCCGYIDTKTEEGFWYLYTFEQAHAGSVISRDGWF